MGRDRRRGDTRVSTMLQARVSPRYARNASKQVLVADLSESGAAVHSESGDLPVSGILNLEFALPDAPDLIHATAELVWQDNEGSAGVRFLDMASYARKRLTQWLKEQSVKENTGAAAIATRLRLLLALADKSAHYSKVSASRNRTAFLSFSETSGSAEFSQSIFKSESFHNMVRSSSGR